MLLLQPQRPAAARINASPADFGRKNSSVASFTSSSHDGNDAEGSRTTSVYHSQSGSSRSHQRGYFDNYASPRPAQQPLASTTDESSDAEFTKFVPQARRRGLATKKQAASQGHKPIKNELVSTKSSGGVGTLRGLGRRLFNRSTSNLKAAPILASRSQSASSSSTSAQSPPLTPTTPPQIQPVWLANGHKDFFSNFSGLPPSLHAVDTNTLDLQTATDSSTGISPKTRQHGFHGSRDSHDDGRRDTFEATSSQGHDHNSTFSHPSDVVSLPSLPSATAAPAGFSSSATRREFPAVIEEEGDSDFLRAVLNFGEGDSDATPSFRGGRAAPLPARSSSLAQIAGFAASPSSYASSLGVAAPPRRTPDGRVLLTQEAARDFANEKPRASYVVVNKKYRKGLFGDDSESEDEYGDDEEEEKKETRTVAPSVSTLAAPENQASVAGLSHNDEIAKYPSSFAKSRTRFPNNDTDDGTAPGARRPVGLDSAAKKALYNCTLLKVHMHLAPTVAGDAEARSQIPAIAAGEVLYGNEDLKFPRSINAESKLRQHMSTYAFSRNLQVALARTEVMRKLRRDRLRIEEEVEISWFQRRYGSASIAPELIAKALRQKQMVSPEALAKPPIAAPSEAAVASVEGLTASRRSSAIEKNGIVTWARRPCFLARTTVLLPADEFAPGEVLVSGATKLGKRGSGAALAVSFSPRVRVLAGLPSVEEERRIKYPSTRQFRPRDMQSKRASRLASKSETAVWEGPDRHRSSARSPRESTLASPTTKQKRLPPWMAPAPSSANLLSPGSMSQSHPALVASQSPAAFSTLHRNSSTARIPELRETTETDEDSSDEEVPLAQLQAFRTQRAAEKERVQKLEDEIAMLRQKDLKRDKDDVERKAREEDARRIEAERAYEERKAAVEARRLEKNRRILQEARDRRGFTRQSVLLAEPNYGAGNPLLGHNRPKQVHSSPSSPNLTLEPLSPGSRAVQHDAALAKLQGNVGAIRPSNTLYALQEGQRRSRTSVVAASETVAASVTSPNMRASATVASPLVDLHRQSSMASLAAPPPTLPHRQSMVQLGTSPPISQRRTSLMPAHQGVLHHTASMQNLVPLPPTSPMLLSPNPCYIQLDPRHSMSMTNLHAQAYLHAQQAQQAQHVQMHTKVAVQRPIMAQTTKLSSRARPILQPLVSLYGDVVPSSAMQRRT